MNVGQSLSAAPCPVALSVGQFAHWRVVFVGRQSFVRWLRAQCAQVSVDDLHSAA